MTVPNRTASFLDKWQARWPEWGIARVFLPASQRRIAFAWFALLQEFTDAAWAGADATPGLAKLAWWSEELQGWAKGARRHPLGEALQPQSAPWMLLAASLRDLQATRGRQLAVSTTHAADVQDADLLAFADVLAQCEARLFTDGTPDAAATGQVARDLQIEYCLLQADPQAADALLAARMPAVGPRPRRLHSALLWQRLRHAAAGQPQRAPSPWRSLWLAWRAARGHGSGGS